MTRSLLLVTMLALLPACRDNAAPAPAAADSAAAVAPASPSGAADPASQASASASSATAPSATAAADGPLSPEDRALLGVWECSGGVPGAQMTFSVDDATGMRTGTLSPMTDDENDDQAVTWTLEPGLLTLRSPEGTGVYHRLVLDGNDLSGLSGEEPFLCSRLAGE